MLLINNKGCMKKSLKHLLKQRRLYEEEPETYNNRGCMKKSLKHV
jgi:hypothetical protein